MSPASRRQFKTSKRRERLEAKRLRIEQRRLYNENYENELAHYQTMMARYAPSFEAVVKFADAAVRSLLLLNGAAALAVITLATHTIGSPSRKSVDGLGVLVLYFGFGAALAVATAGLAYITQVCISEGEDIPLVYKAAMYLRIVAIGCFVMGLIAFM